MEESIDTPIASATPSQRLQHVAHGQRRAKFFSINGGLHADMAILKEQLESQKQENEELKAEIIRLKADMTNLCAMARIDTPATVAGIINKPISIRRIMVETGAYYGVSLADILSDRRLAQMVLARHTSIYLARILTQASYPAIGRVIGNRDHTTCLHAVRKVIKRLENDPVLAADIEAIKARFA
jgi:chromosomal replication initiation ATPase DnaA